jgi:hypothetical protein
MRITTIVIKTSSDDSGCQMTQDDLFYVIWFVNSTYV